MKIEFDRDDLTRCLQQVGTVVERKTTMPILSNILLEASKDSITVSATDLETSMIYKCPAVISEQGKVCIPAKSLMDIVRELPEKKGKLSKSDNEWMNLESGKAQFRVVGTNADKFPKLSETDQFKFMKVRSDTLQSCLEMTAFAISSDEMRYNLNGAYLETAKGDKGKKVLRVVTTDGHRLALVDRQLSDDETIDLKKGVILPRKGVTELRRVLTEGDHKHVELAFSDNAAAFRTESWTIFMRLVVGEFPDYNAVIPKGNKKKLVLDRKLFTHSLKRVSLLSEGKSKCVKLGIRGNGVHLVATSPELGEAEEDVNGEFDGGELDIGFNARYILDALGVTTGDKIVMELDKDTSPGIVRAMDDPGFLGVIMPMRI